MLRLGGLGSVQRLVSQADRGPLEYSLRAWQHSRARPAPGIDRVHELTAELQLNENRPAIARAIGCACKIYDCVGHATIITRSVV
jgi:hypothetical protein